MKNRGFSLVELIIAIVILAIAAAGINESISMYFRRHENRNANFTFESIHDDIVFALIDNPSWINTVSDPTNASFSCLSAGTACAPAPFRVLNAANVPVFDPLTNPNAGFDRAGNPCITFSLNTATSCIYSFDITWAPVCTGTCTPVSQLKVTVVAKINNLAPEAALLRNTNLQFTVLENWP